MKPKILIADDHTLFNEGVKQLLQDTYLIVGQVFDGKFVLSAIQEKNPDVILLDINLPSVNGFDLAVEIKHSFEKLKLFFFPCITNRSLLTNQKNYE